MLEHATRLMARQLDHAAAELLREHLLARGIQVLLGNSVKSWCSASGRHPWRAAAPGRRDRLRHA